jgi:hypothetical protein
MVGQKIILINDELQMPSSFFFLNGEDGWPSRIIPGIVYLTRTL